MTDKNKMFAAMYSGVPQSSELEIETPAVEPPEVLPVEEQTDQGPWTPSRRPQNLSHSNVRKYHEDPYDWVMTYLVKDRADKTPQTEPMSVGSAFDAKVKSELAKELFGEGAKPELEYEAVFESQVEEHNRDFAKPAGEHAFEAYVYSGMYQELLTMLLEAQDEPRFEFECVGKVGGIPIKGYPDCRFIHKSGVAVTLDWKCMGFCSKSSVSPSKGYRLCKDGHPAKKPSRSHNKSHKDYLPFDMGGLEVNQVYMEDCKPIYADQLTVYGWLLGQKVGDENVCVMVDELVWKFAGSHRMPIGRVANHRGRVRKEYQIQLLERYKKVWRAVESGYVFTNMGRQENDDQCRQLERTARQLRMSGTDNDVFVEITKK